MASRTNTPRASGPLPRFRWSLLAFLLLAFSASSFAQSHRQNFDIAKGPAESTLKTLASQSGLEILFSSRTAGSTETNEVRGQMTADEALDQMLAGTGLVARKNSKTGAVTVSLEPKNESRAAENPDRPGQNREYYEKKVVLDTFEVMGSKLLNMDLPRSRDDAQPYVVFGRELLERSGATSLDDFLKQRVTMNTQGQSPSQFLNSLSGNTSSINLRGLGAEQTLILVDGRRVASLGTPSGLIQPDINGIPLSAIERIEILPTTASGIYGGAATGGVINIVLRRDYAGAELRLSYDNTFDSDSAIRTAELSAGFTLEGGKTQVLLAASFKEANSLLFGDRNYVQRGRARVIANNPGAVYNAATPILGATTNIRSSNGSNLSLKPAFGGASLNSPITHVPYGYAGISSDNAAALLANAGRYNLDLAATAQTGAVGGGRRLATQNAPTVLGGMLTVRRQFSPTFQMFLDVAAANNAGRFQTGYVHQGTLSIPSASSANPFNQNITVSMPVYGPVGDVIVDVFTRRATLGAITKLPHEWMVGADVAFSHTRYYGASRPQLPATLNTAIAAGAINVLRDLQAFPIDYAPYIGPDTTFGPARTTQLGGSIRASGPIFSLPAGKATLSGLVEYRDETLEEYTGSFLGVVTTRPERSQRIGSAYVEARVPLFSEAHSVPGIRELELQLAVRHDDYTVNGSIASVAVGAPATFSTNRSRSTNPTVGLKYTPIDGLMFRASYGTGFLPPSVAQLVPGAINPPATFAVVDPRRGNETVVSSYVQGGNPNLKPEESESWGGGAVFSPRFAPSFRLSLDYTRIKKRQNIISNLQASATALQAFVLNEPAFPDRFVRGPNRPGDAPGWPGPITFVDITAANIASADVEALDAAVDYSWQHARLGSFHAYALATRQMKFDTQLVAGAAVVNNVGVNALITSIPVELKANGGVAWRGRRASAGWNVRHSDGFFTRDPTLSTSAATIASQGNGGWVDREIYHDAFAGYRFPANRDARGFARVTAGTEVQFAVKNVFDRPAAFDAGNTTFLYSYLGETRGRSYVITLKRTF